ncbi:AraC family transcriptional regulator [Roseiarcus sp.]|uniref:AraC family transcriptional regulator n=1 Tax=Roseiarcus sp. TaxID=1969460 RepID=UPI003F9A4B21
MTEEGIGQALPTATGFGARLAIAVLKKHNVAPAPILGRAGVSEQDFDSRQRRISAASESKCLEYAAEAMDDSAFGLHLAEEANPREAGLPFYIASAANDIGEALALFARYSRIVNEAMRIKLVRAPDGVVAEITFGDHSLHGAKQVTEFATAVILKGVREVAGRNIRPMHVSFAHGRNSDLRAFERYFRCPVEFGASRDQLAFSNETLALPLVTADPRLLETLRPICDAAAKERNTAIGSLRAAVEKETQKLLPHGKAKRHSVARSLGLSERTLTRKLADEGTTYEQISDQLRQSLALQYIKEQSVSLSQIAWLLGYEGPASFNRAFRRWTGRSPSVARKE